MQLSLENPKNPFESAIHPYKEMAAYEALWKDFGSSFKKIANIFAQNPGKRPSDLVPAEKVEEFKRILRPIVEGGLNIGQPQILISGTYDYPTFLRDAESPVELLYYLGDLELLKTRRIALVGTRTPTKEGIARTEKLVSNLVADKVTIVSGLAAGIDTAAHSAAIAAGGRTIAVLGTPLNKVYPQENSELQQTIAQSHLLVSQVPFFRYSQQDFRSNRGFFPERNKTMSALTEATVIIEAGQTSGTLIQARSALAQGRKLFILESCFQNSLITWPHKFEKLGAIRVRSYDDIKNSLSI